MRIVIALGGNAAAQQGQPMTAENQRANIRLAAERIAAVAPGNGSSSRTATAPGRSPGAAERGVHGGRSLSLDVLGAETEAMIGYVIEQELGNILPSEQPFATLLTIVEVDPRTRPSATR